MTVEEEKRELRRVLRAREAALEEDYRFRADAAIAAGLLALPEYRTAQTVFCFASVGREPDTRVFLDKALQSGKRVCLPLCVSLGRMELRQIDSLAQLVPGAYGIPQPPEGALLVPEGQVALAVIPCLSCDHAGNRLGKGGGFYDCFLAGYSGPAVMVCYERLVSPAIPMEAHDRAVPALLTERGLYREGRLV